MQVDTSDYWHRLLLKNAVVVALTHAMAIFFFHSFEHCCTVFVSLWSE